MKAKLEDLERMWADKAKVKEKVEEPSLDFWLVLLFVGAFALLTVVSLGQL
jgi:hypothetical protein